MGMFRMTSLSQKTFVVFVLGCTSVFAAQKTFTISGKLLLDNVKLLSQIVGTIQIDVEPVRGIRGSIAMHRLPLPALGGLLPVWVYDSCELTGTIRDQKGHYLINVAMEKGIPCTITGRLTLIAENEYSIQSESLEGLTFAGSQASAFAAQTTGTLTMKEERPDSHQVTAAPEIQSDG